MRTPGFTRTQRVISRAATRTQRIQKISVAQCLCGVFFSVSSLFVGGLAGAQTTSWPTERPPQPLPARDIKFPPYDLQALPNGLQVVAVLQHAIGPLAQHLQLVGQQRRGALLADALRRVGDGRGQGARVGFAVGQRMAHRGVERVDHAAPVAR